MKILAIDGNSIVNRAFYGIKLLTTKDGQYTNGIYGFLNILNKLTEQEKPDGVVVAFDVRAKTFRHEKYDEYKAGRKGMPEELHNQIPLLKELIDYLGYKKIELAGFEADDILGTLAKLSTDTNNECVIATGDRDSLQLVSNKVRVLLTATKMGRPEVTDYTPDALFEKYGLTPPQMIELKALMGDSSDNIPGVAGVGEKTATDLISRFDNIDYIYENIDTIDIKDAVRNKLIAGKDSAFLSRWLGTINCEVPIDNNLENYKTIERDESNLSALMTRLEFFKLMENMGVTPSIVGAKKEEKDSVGSFSVVTVGDFKTNGTVDLVADFADSQIALTSDNTVTVFSFSDEKLAEILKDEKTEKRIYDYKNLFKALLPLNIEIKNVGFDSMLAGYLASPSASSYEIERLAQEYSAVMNEIEGDATDLIKTAVLHSAVCDRLYKELEEKSQLSLLKDIEIPLAAVLGFMEYEGFLIDAEGIRLYGEELGEQIADLQAEIYSLVGYEFNLNSPMQLGVALFEKLGLPVKKKTKKGYSTSAEVLEELRTVHPAVELLLQYRQLSKLKSTYCDGLCSAVHSDGKIHSTFNQTETRTGRISSLEPNLQNIPVRQKEGKKLREYFIARDGYVLCDADYSQIELRVLAHLADDQNMIKAFNENTDIHTVTASEVFNIPVDMVTPTMRSRAKAVNFGIVYGIGAFSLSKDIGVTRAEADSYIKNYLSFYKNIDLYMKNTIEQAKKDGFVVTLFGRRRYLPELSSSNRMLQSFGERVARNAPVQGTAADIIKIAMINVYNRLKKEQLDARLILQVHDELIVECKEEIAEYVCEIIKQEMENAATLKVQMTVDVNFGTTWCEAKE